MTMQHLMNCSHSGEGWCLECVNELHKRAEAAEAKRDEYLAMLVNVQNARVRRRVSGPCGGGDPGWTYDPMKVEEAICGLKVESEEVDSLRAANAKMREALENQLLEHVGIGVTWFTRCKRCGEQSEQSHEVAHKPDCLLALSPAPGEQSLPARSCTTCKHDPRVCPSGCEVFTLDKWEPRPAPAEPHRQENSK